MKYFNVFDKIKPKKRAGGRSIVWAHILNLLRFNCHINPTIISHHLDTRSVGKGSRWGKKTRLVSSVHLAGIILLLLLINLTLRWSQGDFPAQTVLFVSLLYKEKKHTSDSLLRVWVMKTVLGGDPSRTHMCKSTCVCVCVFYDGQTDQHICVCACKCSSCRTDVSTRVFMREKKKQWACRS